MSYKFSFADNEVYSATDVNNITKRLVTSGVADSFSDGAAYNVSQFNELGKLLYTAGVVSKDCNTLKVTKANDTEILINPGTAFFNDGAVIEIEAGGEVMPFVSGSKNYVYLKNMLLDENRCYPCVSVNEPTGDFVLLAEINENGNVTDKRTYAKGKLPGYQSVAGNVLRIQENISMRKIDSYRSEGSKIFSIGNNDYEYIVTYVKTDVKDTLPCLGIYDIVNKSYLGFAVENSADKVIGPFYDKLRIRESPNNAADPDVDMTLSLENGELAVSLFARVTNSIGIIDNVYTVDLILF